MPGLKVKKIIAETEKHWKWSHLGEHLSPTLNSFVWDYFPTSLYQNVQSAQITQP
jgi:hypothetical protein